MNNSSLRIFAYVIFIVVFMPLGCMSLPPWQKHYSGDGYFLDNGPRAAAYRYVLDLGIVSANQVSANTYSIGELPVEKFAFGIEGNNLFDTEDLPILQLKLKDNITKETIFDVTDGLDSWIISGFPQFGKPFFYKRETLVHPKRGHTYELSISVVQAVEKDVVISVVIKGGGWK